MSLKHLKAADKIYVSISSIAWVFLFASIGKHMIGEAIIGEIVGIVCGISMSFSCLYAYSKLTLARQEKS